MKVERLSSARDISYVYPDPHLNNGESIIPDLQDLWNLRR